MGMQRTEIFTEQLSHYLAANGITDEAKKRSILLSACGMPTYKLVRTQVRYSDGQNVRRDCGAGPEPLPAEAVSDYAQFRFNACVRHPGESITTFIARLCNLASHWSTEEPRQSSYAIASCVASGTTPFSAVCSPSPSSHSTRPVNWRSYMSPWRTRRFRVRQQRCTAPSARPLHPHTQGGAASGTTPFSAVCSPSPSSRSTRPANWRSYMSPWRTRRFRAHQQRCTAPSARPLHPHTQGGAALQRSLLSIAKLTFDKACELALLHEFVENSKVQSAPTAVHRTEREAPAPAHPRWGDSGTKGRPETPCYRCGGQHTANNCRFKDSSCNFCGKRGHIQRVCRSRRREGQHPPTSRQGSQQRQTHRPEEDTPTQNIHPRCPQGKHQQSTPITAEVLVTIQFTDGN